LPSAAARSSAAVKNTHACVIFETNAAERASINSTSAIHKNLFGGQKFMGIVDKH
jgi:hypothetical protein